MKTLLKLTAILLIISTLFLAAACSEDNGQATDSGIADSSESNTEDSALSEVNKGENSNTEGGDGGTGGELSKEEKEENNPVDISKLAHELVTSFGGVPDAWSFMPDAFTPASYTVEEDGIPTYTDFTQVSTIPSNYVGKQMNVVVSLLNKCETALEYVNVVYGSLNIIEGAYQAFLNDNPENYKSFSGSTESFSYEITLSGKVYLLTASFETIKVTLFSNGEDRSYGARIQLTDGNILKYTVSQNCFKVASHLLNSSSTQIEFVRDDEEAVGYIYEFLTVGGQELRASSTLLHIGKDYTTVVGTKGDFIPTADSRNCEVYNSKTGQLVGTEVKESLGIGGKTYNTLWYKLDDISGITSIKKLDDANVLNPDTIYINGGSDSIHTKVVSLLDPSRRFDIEFKKVTAYVYDAQKEKYEEQELEVPMMFIQEGNFNSFSEDYQEKNDIEVSVTVSKADRDAVNEGYHVMVELYDEIKGLVTQQNIIDYCSADFKIA